MPVEKTPDSGDKPIESMGDLENAFVNAASKTAEETPAVPEASGEEKVAEQVPDSGDAEVQAEETSPDLISVARELGLDGDDPAEILRRLAGQVNDLTPYANYGKEILPYDREVRQVIRQGADGKPVEGTERAKEPEKAEEEWSPQKHFATKWSKPTYDKSWDVFVQSGMVVPDPNTGQYVPAEGHANSVPINVLQGLNEHRQWQRDALERMLDNPYEGAWEAFQEPLNRMLEEKMRSFTGQQTASQQVAEWETRNAEVLYEMQDGQIQLDIYGNPKPTEYGQGFIRACQQLRTGGVTDPVKVIELAMEMVPYNAPTAEPAVVQQEKPVPVEKKESGTFLKDAIDRASHSPNAGGYSESSDIQPVVQNEMDLEQMFVNAAKKAGI